MAWVSCNIIILKVTELKIWSWVSLTIKMIENVYRRVKIYMWVSTIWWCVSRNIASLIVCDNIWRSITNSISHGNIFTNISISIFNRNISQNIPSNSIIAWCITLVIIIISRIVSFVRGSLKIISVYIGLIIMRVPTNRKVASTIREIFTVVVVGERLICLLLDCSKPFL